MAGTVYIFDDMASFTDADLAVALRKVTPRRRLKAQAYTRMIDRKQSVIAELLLMHATGQRDLRLRFVGNGKPAFADSALPHFNLSHCTEAVACAVGDAPLGVDVEPYASYDEEVAREVFNAAELSLALDNPGQFARLWTAKESFLKLTGEGLCDDLPTLMDRAGDACFATCHSAKGYACTLCTRQARAARRFDTLTPSFVGKNELIND